ncbi:MAG: cytochrome c, partial [Planctomycetota bacterium]
ANGPAVKTKLPLGRSEKTLRCSMKYKNMPKSILMLALILACGIGCKEAAKPQVAEYEPNYVLSYNMGQYSEQAMDEALAQTTHALDDLFGTPDEPKLPEFLLEDEDYGTLVSIENIQKAAGPEGLYRKHKCAECHGITGNGRGKTAPLLNPYPRDYRLGRFKFKSTPIGTKPTKEDLAYLIEHGIGGTQMAKIPELTEPDINALVEYVMFLTMRGAVERSLLMEAGELDFTDPDDPDSLYTPALKNSEDEDEAELYEEQWELIQDFVFDAAKDWSKAEKKAFEVPVRDANTVPDTFDEVLAAMASNEDSAIKQSVIRGKELFLGEQAACAKCHGKEGRGDGQKNDYDDWAKDWTKKFGLDPAKPEEHGPLIARGALPVQNVSPRNFQAGVFRAGKTPEKLYQRVALGIEGTPMPAATLESDQIWDIVNFVRSLREPPGDEPVNDSSSASSSDTANSNPSDSEPAQGLNS